MERFLFTVLMITMTILSTYGQTSVAHYYIKIKSTSSDETPFQFEYGVLDVDSEYKIKLVPHDYSNLEDFTSQILSNSTKHKTPFDFNLFIHGIWSDFMPSWKRTIRALTQEVFSKQEYPQIVLSIIWESKISYSRSIPVAYNMGKKISPEIINLLDKISANHKNVIAHSMGNRVFQGIVEAYLPSDHIIIDHYHAMAADLENNIFDMGQPLYDLPTLIANTIIYRHNTDRSLAMSEIINKNQRLGLSGPTKATLQRNGFFVIDVSKLLSKWGLADLSNHRYFHREKQFLKYFASALNNDINQKVLILDFNNNGI